MTIGAFAEFVAVTGFSTKAEDAGGMVYEAGWVVKPDWNWRYPYGIASPPEEPAVHITFDEAMAYCDWRGQRLPSRDEWIRAGHTELRSDPPASFQRGRTYEFPTVNSPEGQIVSPNAALICGRLLASLTIAAILIVVLVMHRQGKQKRGSMVYLIWGPMSGNGR